MDRDELIYKAVLASQNTYSPFSHYPVGAALLATSGKIYLGTNVENDSFGLTMCAERSAIFSAISNGEREFVGMAVVTKDGGTSCGACRQVLAQFSLDTPIYFCKVAGDLANLIVTSIITMTPEEMLPNMFKL